MRSSESAIPSRLSRADTSPIRLSLIETFALEAPVERPVRNSFRTLTSRSALLVRVTDADGACGWGEVWCNFPPNAARHRANLIERVAAPMIVGRVFDTPEQVFQSLEQQLRVPAITSGEPGPFAQITAGIDVAIWDLVARRAGEPLWRLFGGQRTLNVYASGVSPDGAGELVARAVLNGHRAAKLKVGFGSELDRRNLEAMRAALGDDGKLMVDANQKWNVREALDAIRTFAEYKLEWVEEPIPADEPLSQWQALAQASPIALAAGENLRDRRTFEHYIECNVVRFLQPDIGKWGGFTECLPLGRKAVAAGLDFCPHWLGGGVGLLASLHLLGAVGGSGWGEVDANINALQQQFLPEGFVVAEGRVTLSDAPGLGYEPDALLLEAFRVKIQ